MGKDKEFVFLVSWDIRLLVDYPVDHPNFTFINCDGSIDFFDRAKKFKLALLVVKDKSTMNDTSKSGVTLQILQEYLVNYNVKYQTVFLSETTVEKSLELFN